MGTLFDARSRLSLIARINFLRGDEPARWGTLTCAQMVCHVADQLRNGLGELEARPIPGPLARAPINWLIIYVLPWPKARAQSPPEFLARRPSTWEEDRNALNALVDRFGAQERDAVWPANPVFGRISASAWGVLAYRHLDHHLRQFGV